MCLHEARALLAVIVRRAWAGGFRLFKPGHSLRQSPRSPGSKAMSHTVTSFMLVLRGLQRRAATYTSESVVKLATLAPSACRALWRRAPGRSPGTDGAPGASACTPCLCSTSLCRRVLQSKPDAVSCPTRLHCVPQCAACCGLQFARPFHDMTTHVHVSRCKHAHLVRAQDHIHHCQCGRRRGARQHLALPLPQLVRRRCQCFTLRCLSPATAGHVRLQPNCNISV